MNRKVIRFIKDWTLPLAMAGGAAVYCAFHFCSFLHPIKNFVYDTGSAMLPVLMFALLFVTFCKIDPKQMQVRKWHLWLCLFQVIICGGLCLFLYFMPDFKYKVLIEGAMICMICPTATAAPVITGKLGGNETTLTTYTIISNIAAAITIPLLFPLIELHQGLSFINEFWIIIRKVFPLMIFPFLLAWAYRAFFPDSHAKFISSTKDLGFYMWAFNLLVVLAKSISSVVESPVSTRLKWLLALIGLLCCIIQFAFGKTLGSHYGERITVGQALGQKNTIFAIWVVFVYLTPVVAIAPSSYILWQNIFNSWQIYRFQKHNASTSATS